MKNKILTAVLSIFFIVVVLNLNNVFGIGIIGQAYKKLENGKWCLIFREFTAPHSSTLKSYHEKSSTDYVEDGAWKYVGPDGEKYTSKWISTTNSGYSTPSWYTFRTIGFAFHTEQMNDYSSKGNPYIGYNWSTATIDNKISSIKSSFTNSVIKYTTPKTKNNYSDVVFFELMKSTGTYTSVNWGTGLTISNIKHANYTEYRYAIVSIDGNNIHVSENIIYEDNLVALIKKAKELGKTDGCYISNIITSKARDDNYTTHSGEMEVARTVKAFFSQYDMGYGTWGSGTRGLSEESKAMGAVANLYDNEIKFPQLSKRSVMVRHINIGTNTVISTDIVKNGSMIKSNNLTITATNPEATVRGTYYTGSTYPNYKDAEYYSNAFDMEQNIYKSSLENTTTYKCIGSNTAVAASWSSAMSNIDTKIRNGTFDKVNSVSVLGSKMMSDADYVVIDFYYTEYEKDVHVNHLYVDQDGSVIEIAKQTIVPNERSRMYVGETASWINRINSDKYISETYVKRMGKKIVVRKADSLNDNEYISYIGHEKLTSKIAAKDIVGTKRTGLNAGTSADIDGNIVQVNFYYQIEKDVHVNHLYIDKDGYVRKLQEQNIVPNTTAKMHSSTNSSGTKIYSDINRTNSDKYIIETYLTKLGKEIVVRNADSLDNDADVIYVGYEKLTAKTAAKDIVGVQKTQQNLTTGETASITGNTIQVNFYYQIEKEIELDEPEKTIEGSVFITGTNTSTTIGCKDEIQLDLENYVTTIPSGTNAKVGVEGIPKYMVAAITTEYVSPMKTAYTTNLSTTFKMGPITKNVNFTDIVYRVGYYKVTDMAVFKLKNTSIYDAGYTGTTGTSLFDWDERTVLPKDMALNVELTGINGNTIANTNSAINNVNNYVSLRFEDSNGKEFIRNQTYLTTNQLNEVDANSDEKVDSTDKTYAKNMLDDYNTTLTTKKNIQSSKQTAYEDSVEMEKTLKSKYDAAATELARLKRIYDTATRTKTNKWTAISDLQGEINRLQHTTIVNLYKELRELQEDESAKLTAKENAETALIQATARQSELNTIYLNSIDERNMLAAKANCNDALDEEVYIYVDIYKEQIEAAEQCRTNKETYNQNIKNRVVENALAAYESYTQNEWKTANNAVITATNEHEAAERAIEAKESEIASKNLELVGKGKTLDTLTREYNKFIEDTYTPAKNAYEQYESNEYATAKKNYDDYVNGDYVQKALDELNAAKSATQQAQSQYDSYKAYRDNLLVKYDSYKALYDEFMKIYNAKTNADVADLLGLNLNIFVQNMTVKVNGEVLTEAKNNTAVKTYKLSTLLRNADNTTYQVTTERPVINKDVYSLIGSTILTPESYNNSYKVNQTATNGVRALAGKVEYEAQVVIGENSVREMKDTIYYSDQSSGDTTAIFKLKTTKLEKTYQVNSKTSNDEEKYAETKPVNIYTPITVSAKLESKSSQIVNQIQNQDLETSVIQLNTPFTITLDNDGTPFGYTKLSDTSKYSGGYYVKFDFDVHKVKINGRTYNSGNRIPAGTWIGFIEDIGDTTITAQAYGNLESDEQGVIAEENSSYTVRAVAYNATTNIRNEALNYDTLSGIREGVLKNNVNNLCLAQSSIPAYFDQETYNVIIVNRAFDFRVTDVKDMNWKSVFRYSSGGNTNRHNGISYYSGTTKWNTASEKNNDIINRTSAEIGRNPLRILPLGPYKNTDSTYIKAPKMGYRFSFDMKVTGSYYDSNSRINTKKKVDIVTKFYYISKDGKTYKPEASDNKAGIYLFYKTSAGKYVRIDQDIENGGGYELRFTPNDGYRYIEDRQKGTLATTSVILGNLRKLTLKHNMATISNNGAVITYYGEYKLPNSTIAVEVDADGNYDINKPLMNGYIGVVFDIVAYSGEITLGTKTTEVALSYSKDTNGDNTSQWDYEGFLGFDNSGHIVQSSNPVTLKLEKGTWKINNTIYNEIKGSVMLYDLDERAATDYE